MNRAILEKLKDLKPKLQEDFGISRFALFGSQARDDYNEKSDIDIVVFEMKLEGGFDLLRAKSFIEKNLGTKVDMGTYKSLKTFIKNRIQKDLIYV